MCRDGDTSKIYVVSDALVQMMDRNIYQLVQIPQIPVLAPEALVSIQVQGGDVSRTASRDGDGSWLCDTKDVSAEVESFVALLGQGLALQSCVDYNPSSGAYPICGLTEPAVSVTVSYSSGKGGTDSFALKLGLAYGDGYFAVYNDVPAIFKVSADTAATLTGLLTLGA